MDFCSFDNGLKQLYEYTYIYTRSIHRPMVILYVMLLQCIFFLQNVSELYNKRQGSPNGIKIKLKDCMPLTFVNIYMYMNEGFKYTRIRCHMIAFSQPVLKLINNLEAHI